MSEALKAFAQNEANKIRAALHKARTPEDFHDITRTIHQRLDTIFADGLKSTGKSIACKAGCSFCCYIKVDAQPHELFRLVSFINRNFSPEKIAQIKARAEANRKIIEPLTAEQQLFTNIPCPLLEGGVCSVYEARPGLCRTYHAQNVTGCEAAYREPDKLVDPDEIPQIRVVASFVRSAITRTFATEGYDHQPYDLSSALPDALSNPKCEKRWRDKKTAFSKNFLAKDWKEAMTD